MPSKTGVCVDCGFRIDQCVCPIVVQGMVAKQFTIHITEPAPLFPSEKPPLHPTGKGEHECICCCILQVTRQHRETCCCHPNRKV